MYGFYWRFVQASAMGVFVGTYKSGSGGDAVSRLRRRSLVRQQLGALRREAVAGPQRDQA
ncbi:hypothetical protein [Streptomyces sp. NPDC001315]|uniref:hypothetical protein n=1 Tax=Streptomyces sp. NPDC001315 TaxID=3364562 RepID=UPI0036C8FE76